MTDLIIWGHSREGTALSCSGINTVVCLVGGWRMSRLRALHFSVLHHYTHHCRVLYPLYSLYSSTQALLLLNSFFHTCTKLHSQLNYREHTNSPLKVHSPCRTQLHSPLVALVRNSSNTQLLCSVLSLVKYPTS